MHKDLKLLFDEDQYECINQPRDGTPEYFALRQKCKVRISKVKEMLESNKSLSGDDYFHASILFMHGDCPDDFWQAYTLFRKALDQNYKDAKRFAAAAFDKWLMYQGKPQKFGLQYVPDGVRLKLWDVDPRTTDNERAEWDVPTLQELNKNIKNLNETFDISTINMETKPQWLKDAIQRWNSQNND
jgi:TPR repeat protein